MVHQIQISIADSRKEESGLHAHMATFNWILQANHISMALCVYD